jgi:uncharacterized surface protein with fasciclin (FAS1) repeats
MKRSILVLLGAILFTGFASATSFAQTAPAPATTILSVLGDESNYNTFAGFVRSTYTADALKALGPYTLFAPHNILIRNMSPEKLDSVRNDPAKLTELVKAHIIKGKLTRADINKKLTAGKGKATLTNLLGQPLALSLTSDSRLVMTDAKGNQAFFIEFDILDPQAVVHGIDNVLIIGK